MKRPEGQSKVQPSKQTDLPNLSRRQFLKQSGAAVAGAYAGFYVPRFLRMGPHAGPSGNMQYRMLGRSGLSVSEIGFGGYPVKDPNVVRYAIDKGINYIDTAADYTGGLSETTIGKAIRGRRQDVVLTTKWHPHSKTTAREMMNSLNTSLRRLQTDYVDGLLVHEVGTVSDGEGIKRLYNDELFKAIEMAKKQGKARYFGCSGHDPDLMQIMNYAVTIPEFSFVLCRYNYKKYPTEAALFKKAKDRGVGVIGMKTLGGARGEDLSKFRDKGATFKQGALKWVLSNPDISNLIISISSREQVDEYVLASGRSMQPEEASAINASTNVI